MLVRTRVVALALAALACGRSRSPGPSPALSAMAGESAAQHGVVTAKSGKVELLRATDGTVSEAHVGDRLGVRDAVRTEEGDADLSFDGVRMRLHDASQLTVEQMDRQKVRAKVRGSVESDVADHASLDVEVEGGDATAHSDGGHFFVTSDGHGVVAVATVTGSVHLAGSGKSVEVGKGQVSRLSRVFVQGEAVLVEAGGAFHAEVPLRQGRQKIAVVTMDALGRRRQVESVVVRDDSIPEIKVKKKLWQWR